MACSIWVIIGEEFRKVADLQAQKACRLQLELVDYTETHHRALHEFKAFRNKAQLIHLFRAFVLRYCSDVQPNPCPMHRGTSKSWV